MTFKLNIEKVTGGYILTKERPDGVERFVIGIDSPILNNHGVLNIIDKAVGYTILTGIDFKATDKHVVLNVECYGDVEGESGTSETQEFSEADKKMYNLILARLYTHNPTQPETMASKWFKEHCYKKPLWKPSKEQIDELYSMICECRHGDAQLLQDLYYGLQSLL